MSMVVPTGKHSISGGKGAFPAGVCLSEGVMLLTLQEQPGKAEGRAAARPPRGRSFILELFIETLLCSKHWTVQ